MKPIYNLIFLTALLFSLSCEDDEQSGSVGSVVAEDFVYSTAIDYSATGEGGTVQVISSGGVELVYCYLVRDFLPDAIIYRAFPEEGQELDYTFVLPYNLFPAATIESVRGVKIMVKQKDNSTVEGFVNLSVYDPAVPALSGFIDEITPDVTGAEPSVISGTATSEAGLKQIDIYDNYNGEWNLVHSISPLNGALQSNVNYNYTYRRASSQLKIEAVDVYDRISIPVVIELDVDLSLFLPVFTGFPEVVEPDVSGGTTPITGMITSITGLKQIDIYDDYQGTEVLVESITGLSGVNTYTFAYDYLYRPTARNLKIQAVDIEDGTAQVIVVLNIVLPYTLYENVTMMGQGSSGATGTASESSFFLNDGTVIGNCEVLGNEGLVDFAVYVASGPLLGFRAPTNLGGVLANYWCNGVQVWAGGPPTATLTATRFRVLLPGATPEEAIIYAHLNNGTIGELSDAFFTNIPVPSSSTVSYNPTAAPSSTLFDITTTYLVYVRIPRPDGSFTNGLIHIKAANLVSPQGLSTVTFDLYLEK